MFADNKFDCFQRQNFKCRSTRHVSALIFLALQNLGNFSISSEEVTCPWVTQLPTVLVLKQPLDEKKPEKTNSHKNRFIRKGLVFEKGGFYYPLPGLLVYFSSMFLTSRFLEFQSFSVNLNFKFTLEKYRRKKLQSFLLKTFFLDIQIFSLNNK